MEVLSNSRLVSSFDIVAFNPSLDLRGKSARVIIDLFAAFCDGTSLGAQSTLAAEWAPQFCDGPVLTKSSHANTQEQKAPTRTTKCGHQMLPAKTSARMTNSIWAPTKRSPPRITLPVTGDVSPGRSFNIVEPCLLAIADPLVTLTGHVLSPMRSGSGPMS